MMSDNSTIQRQKQTQQQMQKKLDGVQPVTDAAQRDFYRKMAEKYLLK